jgi:hypothetical protein
MSALQVSAATPWQSKGQHCLGSLDEFSSSNPPSAKIDEDQALAGMAVDVLSLLTVIIIGSAVLLAQGRRDG